MNSFIIILKTQMSLRDFSYVNKHNSKSVTINDLQNKKPVPQ